MAAILPTDVFANYELVAAAGTVTAESVCIPLAALTELTSAEANATTGDGSQLIRAIDIAIHAAIQALDPGDRPVNINSTVTAEYTSPLTRTRIFRRSYNEAVEDNDFDVVPE
jgi:methionine aminopeptidase